MRASSVFACAALCVYASLSSAQGVTVTHASGGPIKTELGFGITLNEGSSLNREWTTVHDPSLPADLDGTTGVETTFDSNHGVGSYKYQASYVVKTKEALSAVEVRFVVFDVWGNLIRTLNATDVVDMDAETSNPITSKWNLFSESEASDYYASIAYIARVRTKAGRIVEANPQPVLAEAKKLSAKFRAEDLEPKHEQK